MTLVAIAALDCALAAMYGRRPLGRNSWTAEATVIASFDASVVLSLVLLRRFRRGGIRGWGVTVLALWSLFVAFTAWGLFLILFQP